MGRKTSAVYGFYKGDEILAIGTAEEISKIVGIKPKTVYFYATKSCHKRIDKNIHTYAIRLEDDLEDEMS